ncbi:hypothetical protein Pst134EA_013275 [Puccinia striiformis f. sp. tritici]|uniref:hypothetical protein n=1 Tax=Puccinia striiformis f. sp. tritici TaxID=168172 RepID=UPI00200806CF|nr:hypothetical protein Pst134EA_013275 [Puccinia striiformis f. sp. tritici]KAH9465391.1 hypothetical protein Pst134EA_013275 [Puccinia striiformis f. sp. tritici]
MPATRSSGPPTAASLQPILMEALENFKQKHSKQNQDLIHKNRFLLKSTAELERVIKDLKDENLELRIQVQKANTHAQYWRQISESSSSSNQVSDQTQQIRIALIDIANRCKTLESSLPHPQRSPLPNSSNHPTQVPPSNPLASFAPGSDSLPPLLAARSRAELLALRERRRSQFAVEPEESRLSFINECSGTEDRSESTLPIETWQSGSIDIQTQKTSSSSHATNQQASEFPPGPSNHTPKSLQHQFVVSRPNRRQELMAPVPKSSKSSTTTNSSRDEVPDALKTSAQQVGLECIEDQSDDGFEKQDSSETENESLPDDQTSASFSVHNRAMSQLEEESLSSNSSDSEPDPREDAESKQDHHRSEKQKTDIQLRARQTQRRSRKQRRTSLTPLHILENISPGDFTLPAQALSSPKNAAHTNDSNQSLRTNDSDETKGSGTELGNSGLAVAPPSSVKRRDSGLTKEETEENIEIQLSQDEGWEKRAVVKKKRVRAELDAVREEHPGPAHNNENGIVDQASTITNLSGAGSREARRVRKEVNYALPSLNKKMRRPDSDGASVAKRKSSIKPNPHQNLQATAPTTLKPKSTSSNKSSGATPSTVQSNTSCNTTTTLSLNSSPLSSVSSSADMISELIPNNTHSSSSSSSSVDHLNKPFNNRLLKNPTTLNINNLNKNSDQSKDILLNRGRRRTNNL